MNLICGVVSGFYLCELATAVPSKHRGIVFGGGYAAASILGWLLSLAKGGAFLHTGSAMILYAVFAAAAVVMFIKWLPSHVDSATSGDGARNTDVEISGLIALAFATVFALSLVKGLGFGFPTTDLAEGVSLELSRVSYAAGLVAAGVVCDHSRRYGALCCLAVLVVPFIMLALAGEPISRMVFWCLGYLLFGFFSVYRAVLFCDIAAEQNQPWLSGLGLAGGRIGDALAVVLFTAIGSEHIILLITVTALLFAGTVFLFFRLYQRLYATTISAPAVSEHERFEGFCADYGLSSREREVLHHLIDGRTNSEIAGQMFVSESTVKFHVHNLLGKTECANRLELLELYTKTVR